MDGVVHTPGTCGGAPRIASHRLTVHNVASLLKHLGLDRFREVHSDIPLEHVRDALRYCAARRCQKDQPVNYCCGCALDTRREHRAFEEYVQSIRKVICADRVVEGDGTTDLEFTGTWAQLQQQHEEERRGTDGWVLAAEVADHLNELSLPRESDQS